MICVNDILTQSNDMCQRLHLLKQKTVSFPLRAHRLEREHLRVWIAVSHHWSLDYDHSYG